MNKDSVNSYIELKDTEFDVTLTELIEILEKGTKYASKLDTTSLLSSLRKLDAMIGLKSIKNKIAEFICSIIIPIEGENDAGVFYNIVITGPPGVGKTQLGTLIAQIMGDCKIIKKNKPKIIPPTDNYKSHVAWWMLFIKQQMYEASYDIWNSDIEIPEVSQRLSWIDQIATDIYNDLSGSSLRCQNPRCSHCVTIPPEEPKKQDHIEKVKVTILNRSVLLGPYQGHTIANTKKLLEDGKDGVFILDELYSMLVDDKDSFGTEALNHINEFMSLNPHVPFIFMGYRDKLEESVFKAQPGFKSRIQWYLYIDGYTHEELAQIYLSKIGININNNITQEWLAGILRSNSHVCKGYGRDITKLCFRTIVSLKTRLLKRGGPEEVTRDDILRAISSLKKECKCDNTHHSYYT